MKKSLVFVHWKDSNQISTGLVFVRRSIFALFPGMTSEEVSIDASLAGERGG